MLLRERTNLGSGMMVAGLSVLALVSWASWVGGAAPSALTHQETAHPHLTIYYWPFPARAHSLLSMCAVACAPCTHVHSYDRIAAVASANGGSMEGGGVGDTFAPPIVVDEDNQGFAISQSVAATLYVGQRLGFDAAVPNVPKSVQYMVDLADFLAQIPGGEGPTLIFDEELGRKLAHFHTSGRFDAWMQNIERSIIGPYYYGERVSYVDFYLNQVLKWIYQRIYRQIPGAENVFGAYPKAMGVQASVSALDVTTCPVLGSPFPLTTSFPSPDEPFSKPFLDTLANTSIFR
ncbi:hypothetical protein AB1Y20_009308 [Prymnesium parvum]|uniref:Glutathione transferase n=1 Tax=Prymnesium parvum TaxID=97485 RepID=A0AB34K440_PRYPA